MYLFLVRHFNDIDHIAPVVWKMKKDKYPVAVYCINPRYDIHNDYRLQFLKSQGVTVEYLHDAFDRPRGPLGKFVHALMKKGYAVQKPHEFEIEEPPGTLYRLYRQVSWRLRSKFNVILHKIYYGRGWERSILVRTGAQVICFDHIRSKHYIVDAFLKASRALSIPSLALPHGVYLYTNQTTKPKATDSRRLAKFRRYDYIIATNELRKQLLVNSGIAEEKISVLGCARYCAEWLDQNQKILPGANNFKPQNSAKLKVVLMPSKPQCRVDVDRLLNTCALLADLDGVEAMVKPHTRTPGAKNLFHGVPLPDVSHVLTAELCEWADVLLNVGSSVITEALMKGKPALYLKYLHENTTLFEELGSCWTINDENELKNALLSLQADKKDIPYSEESVAAFLSDIVNGGVTDSDVLGRYEDFIVNCAVAKQSPRPQSEALSTN
jgi:hypothetical protein